MVTSGNLVDAGAAALLDGHPADGGLGCQLLFGWKLLLQDSQDRVHFQVHLVDLNQAQRQNTDRLALAQSRRIKRTDRHYAINKRAAASSACWFIPICLFNAVAITMTE